MGKFQYHFFIFLFVTNYRSKLPVQITVRTIFYTLNRAWAVHGYLFYYKIQKYSRYMVDPRFFWTIEKVGVPPKILSRRVPPFFLNNWNSGGYPHLCDLALISVRWLYLTTYSSHFNQNPTKTLKKRLVIEKLNFSLLTLWQ